MDAARGRALREAPKDEIELRYRKVREAAARDGLDAVIVSGNEYTGFEGSVSYLSGFQIVHRYAYVLLPLDEPPSIVFPREARYVGENGTTWIDDQVFVDTPGAWLRERAQERGWKRLGVYGLDYVMAVRDYVGLAAGEFELVGWDVGYDHARAVKSAYELESVRESVRINTGGFWVFLDAYEPGLTEQDVLAPCEEYFTAQGCGRLTMNMVLDGDDGSALPEFKIARERRLEADDLVLPSLEIAGPGWHWVEVSRPILPGEPSDDTKRMLEAYEEYYAVAQEVMRDGATAHDVHRAVSKGFVERGYQLGHVTGHSIGMTMIEFPKIGEGVDTPLRENMVLSMHPHAISADGRACLYMQDTWLVGADRGIPLAGLPMRIFEGSEEVPEEFRDEVLAA